jgi:hypothetical protein
MASHYLVGQYLANILNLENHSSRVNGPRLFSLSMRILPHIEPYFTAIVSNFRGIRKRQMLIFSEKKAFPPKRTLLSVATFCIRPEKNTRIFTHMTQRIQRHFAKSKVVLKHEQRNAKLSRSHVLRFARLGRSLALPKFTTLQVFYILQVFCRTTRVSCMMACVSCKRHPAPLA